MVKIFCLENERLATRNGCPAIRSNAIATLQMLGCKIA